MLHEETVEPSTLGLLKELMLLDELRQFRLVGGTALSLLLGHRNSIDLDLFTDTNFDSSVIIEKLATTYPNFAHKEVKSPRLFFTTVNNIKIDFVHTFEKFNHDYEWIEDIRFASLPEIAALKLNAIAGRGAKKDYWDLFELLNHYSFEQLIDFYHERYPRNSDMMIIKSIPYFVEAEKDVDPYSFKNITWGKVKKEILTKFNLYIKNKK